MGRDIETGIGKGFAFIFDERAIGQRAMEQLLNGKGSMIIYPERAMVP